MSTTATTKMMNLNVFLSTAGYHSGSWRRPGSRSGELLTIDVAADMTRAAERAKIDAVFIADSLGVDSTIRKAPRQTELEPVTMMAALAMATERIGLIGTLSTTFTEPFNLSRYLGSIDHISRGRVGWNIVTSTGGNHNFGVELPSHDERYRRAYEYVEVVKALWDSWDDDAVVNDSDSGFWLRPERVHRIDHDGEHYKVDGPAHLPRSPQGWPVLVQAGSSKEGMAFAAQHAEVVFTAQNDLAKAQDFYGGMSKLCADIGKPTPRVLPGLMPILGSTEEEAQRLFDELGSYIDVETGLIKLGNYMPGIEFSDLELDEPIPLDRIPDVDVNEAMRSRYEGFHKLAVVERKTLRELMLTVTRSIGHKISIGTPEQVADEMERWFHSDACDGFNLQIAYSPGAMDDIADQLVPELRRRGLFRKEYDGTTLRDHLGLARPADRSNRSGAER